MDWTYFLFQLRALSACRICNGLKIILNLTKCCFLTGRTEAARFLLEAGAPAAIYDDMGNSCLSLMVEKMPGIAIEALEQFHSTDRALRKKYYYLNYLEKMSATDDGENSEGSAKTALQVF